MVDTAARWEGIYRFEGGGTWVRCTGRSGIGRRGVGLIIIIIIMDVFDRSLHPKIVLGFFGDQAKHRSQKRRIL